MSTSLLYHGFGIVGYSYIRADSREGNIFSHYRWKNSISIARYAKANGLLSMVLCLVGFNLFP